mgnify:CR=1 FL=1
MHKTHKLKDHILLFLIYLSALFSVLVLVCIIGYVVIRGIRNVNLTFLTTVTSAIRQTTGIAGNIVNTLYIVVLTLLIATPIGIGSAIYLNEYAKGGKFVRLIEFTTETLSGIPSIIFGRYGVLRNSLRIWVFDSDRCAHPDDHDSAIDHKKYTGSAQERS